MTTADFRRPHPLLYAVSLAVAALLATASVAGLAFPTAVYPTDDLARALVPNDVVNLVLGLPILLGSLWLARRGKLLGLLCWPGALFFVLYDYLIYVLAMPPNVAFLLHLSLVTLSVYGLVGLVAGIDAQAAGRRLTGVVPERLAGGILFALGSLFLLRAVAVAAGSLAGQAPLAATALAVDVADFLTTPAWIVGGFLLWRRYALGYVVGLGLLFQASMLFVALIVFLLLQPVLTSAPFAPLDVAVVFAMGLICFVPFALFVRGVVSPPRPSSA